MTVQQIKSDWVKIVLPVVISFFMGIMITSFSSAITYAGKVDVLSQKIGDMSTAIKDLTIKLDTREDQLHSLDVRVSVLEREKK